VSTREKVSIDEACAFLECEKPKLLELLREGVVPGLKYGKAWVIPREAFFGAMNRLACSDADKLAQELAAERDAARKTQAAIDAAKPKAVGAPRRARSI
jgi:excisionase family DNA binding protein